MHNDTNHSRMVFAFWLYILSDVIIFAGLFATYAVLRAGTFGGPGPQDLLNVPYVFVETLALLGSSFVYGLALIAANLKAAQGHKIAGLLTLSLLLGMLFLGLEVHEFASLVAAGHGPGASAFLSGFFALVGTHGLHVALGSVWMLVMIVQVLDGVSQRTYTRLYMLGVFWHFLDVIWICIFTLVYLMSATL